MRFLRSVVIFVVVCLVSVLARGQTIPAGQTIIAKVVGITDGDTVNVINDEKIVYKLRLDGIDAPESSQAFGRQSRQVLADKIFGKHVYVLSRGQDRYGRTLAIIRLDSKVINSEMVAEGFAWHYKQYSDSKVLADAEMNAREKKLGLWLRDDQIPPWEFRRMPKTKPEITPSSDKIVPPKPEITSADKIVAKYWITTSSGIRHNPSCRYYENSKGHYCGKSDGRACKICGG